MATFPAQRNITYQRLKSEFSTAIVGDQIPASQARVAWNENEKGEVTEVFIDVLSEAWDQSGQIYSKSGGACFGAWLEAEANHIHDNREVHSDLMLDVLGTFGVLNARGFASTASQRNALVEFARIDSCDWARRLLFAFDIEHNREVILGEEP